MEVAAAKRRRRSSGPAADLRLDSGLAAAAVAPEYGEYGLLVWAKFDTFRPWPAHVRSWGGGGVGCGVGRVLWLCAGLAGLGWLCGWLD